jgi:SAM-dependent methyltransferase
LSGLFDAAGYANARPPMHPRLIERIAARLDRRFRYALDLGCGAGLSTAPLSRMADVCIGLEPYEPMLAHAGGVAPHAEFLAGSAEVLPFRPQSIDLVTAAGSLNYTDLPRALAEIRRVLTADGVLVVYDFSQGRSFPDSLALDEWFLKFVRRYPPPPGEGIEIDPRRLSGFTVKDYEEFEIGLPLTPQFYLEYALTETNVSHAVRTGAPRAEIRAWIEASLRPVFAGRPRDVLFRGYTSCLTAN